MLRCVGARTVWRRSLEPPVAGMEAHGGFLAFSAWAELLVLSCGQVWEGEQMKERRKCAKQVGSCSLCVTFPSFACLA